MGVYELFVFRSLGEGQHRVYRWIGSNLTRILSFSDIDAGEKKFFFRKAEVWPEQQLASRLPNGERRRRRQRRRTDGHIVSKQEI